ncbi:MAG TPA: fumarate reductase subunit FrdD [Terriglobales bacterium]|nr:fumarate reductase subunit FrdD [Terriglobales bacterium]
MSQVKASNEPIFWTLFSAGGVVAALLLPIQLLIFGLAAPLGWLPGVSYSSLAVLMHSPITRIYFFVLCSLPLFHFAHRFRYTLYDGLQIKHLNEVVFAGCYGAAVVGTVVAGWLLWRM